MKHLITLTLLLVLTSTMWSQSIKDTKRILGKWKFTETERTNRSNNVLIKIEGDSIVVMIEDDYGNYDPTSSKNLRFPVVPKRSGPKGMYFEKTSSTVDEESDTITVSRWLEFTSMSSKKVGISTGWIHNVKLEKSRDLPFQRWLKGETENNEEVQKLKDKKRLWRDDHGRFTLVGEKIK